MGDDTPVGARRCRPPAVHLLQTAVRAGVEPADRLYPRGARHLAGDPIGNQRNLLDETPEHAEQIVSDTPVLTDAETAALRELPGPGEREPADRKGDEPDASSFTSVVVDVTYDRDGSLVDAVNRIREDAATAIEDGADAVVLSDRAVGTDRLAVPSLLATGAAHHHLVRNGLRNRAGSSSSPASRTRSTTSRR